MFVIPLTTTILHPTDFNFAPDDAAYSLLVGEPLLPAQVDNLSISRVVHLTVDPTVPKTTDKTATDDDEEGAQGESEEQDPDRIIVNARRALPEDGLLSDDELIQLFDRVPRPISTYDKGLSSSRSALVDVKDITFGGRVDLGDRRGSFEPMWTSYTHVSIPLPTVVLDVSLIRMVSIGRPF